MATYKVLQDIEAEDKLVGPLTLKQLIFAIVFIGIGFVEFKIITATGLSVVRWPFVIVLLFPLIIFGFLAAPISRDQPNDVWLLARIRFLIKPHRRIWNQDGISQLVTITVPKRLEQILTNGLNQNEVQSRLSALASTLDSRGWAVKNVDINMFGQPGYLATDDGSDRLVAPTNLPVSQQTVDIAAADDMMDARSNPTAQHLDQMVQASTAAHKQQVINSVQRRDTPNPAATPDYWFLNQPAAAEAPLTPKGLATFQTTTVVTPTSTTPTSAVSQPKTPPTAAELALLERIEAEKALGNAYHSHLKTIQPLGSQTNSPHAAITTPQNANDPLPVTPDPAVVADSTILQTTTPNPAILSLANNDDLNVATIARQARQISEADGEVVISLH